MLSIPFQELKDDRLNTSKGKRTKVKLKIFILIIRRITYYGTIVDTITNISM